MSKTKKKVIQEHLKKQIIKKNTNKKPNKKTLKSVSKKQINLYEPTINKIINQLSTKTMNTNEFGCKNIYDVRIKDKTGKYLCVPYKNEEAQNYLLKLLQTNYRFDKIIAPKQVLSNCWFNTMFMVFFISDRGRIFTKMLRYIMITGKTLNNITLEPKTRDILFVLNKAIQQSLDGNKHSTLINDTNNIIHNIYTDFLRIIERNARKHALKIDDVIYINQYLKDINEAGNPIHYLSCICKFLQFDKINMSLMKYDKLTKKYDLLNYVLRKTSKTRPDILILMYKQNTEVPNMINNNILFNNNNKSIVFGKNTSSIKDKNIFKYTLDSCVLGDNNTDHFMAFLTYNQTEYYFDGYTRSRIKEYKWKNNIHSKKNMVFQNSKIYENQRFNFGVGLCYLIYYLE